MTTGRDDRDDDGTTGVHAAADGLSVLVGGDDPVVTLHLDDHHLVLETTDGEAVGAWRDVRRGLDFARALVAAAPHLRVIVSTWPAEALGALAEHLRRQGWRLGIGWPEEVALLGTGTTHRPADVLEALLAAGAATPPADRPVDEGLAPIGRHHVWHEGGSVRVEQVDLEGRAIG